MSRVFYFHVPKTAGTSLNDFFKNSFKRSITHIEGRKNLDKRFLYNNDFVSGHVTYTSINKLIELRDWFTLITFREPYSHIISHLSWIRKLANPEEKKRFEQHPEIFQKIALKMKKYDYSDPKQIEHFIKWLESICFYYLHNTQTIYLDDQKRVEVALENMKRIDFVGITEQLDDFVNLLSYELVSDVYSKKAPISNVNKYKYGFDLSNPDTKEALLPLIDKDIIIYNEAVKSFVSLKKKYNTTISGDIIGWVDSVSFDKIVGWAKDKNKYIHLNVGLFINKVLVSKSVADIYREGLKRNNCHFTGHCEFRINVPNSSLKSGNTIAIKELSNNIKINITENAINDLNKLGLQYE